MPMARLVGGWEHAGVKRNAGDIVLDSFLGSGTTAAVAHKMGRRWIGIEMGEHARTHCLPRLTKVVEGEQGGISEAVGWKGGGGFRFMKLGAKAFSDEGALNPEIRFKDLAAYLWFLETRIPHESGQFTSPLLGVHNGTAYVLLFNGIIADSRPERGNVLTTAVWNDIRKLLPRDRRETVIYGEASRFSASRLKTSRSPSSRSPTTFRCADHEPHAEDLPDQRACRAGIVLHQGTRHALRGRNCPRLQARSPGCTRRLRTEGSLPTLLRRVARGSSGLRPHSDRRRQDAVGCACHRTRGSPLRGYAIPARIVAGAEQHDPHPDNRGPAEARPPVPHRVGAVLSARSSAGDRHRGLRPVAARRFRWPRDRHRGHDPDASSRQYGQSQDLRLQGSVRAPLCAPAKGRLFRDSQRERPGGAALPGSPPTWARSSTASPTCWPTIVR